MTAWRCALPNQRQTTRKKTEQKQCQKPNGHEAISEAFAYSRLLLTSFTTWTLLWYGHWNQSKWWKKDWYHIETLLEKWKSKKVRQKLLGIYIKSHRVCLPASPASPPPPPRQQGDADMSTESEQHGWPRQGFEKGGLSRVDYVGCYVENGGASREANLPQGYYIV